MNAEGLALGEKLRKFKQESMGLSPPLRGNLITNSAWIRTAHNSFARYAPNAVHTFASSEPVIDIRPDG